MLAKEAILNAVAPIEAPDWKGYVSSHTRTHTARKNTYHKHARKQRRGSKDFDTSKLKDLTDTQWQEARDEVRCRLINKTIDVELRTNVRETLNQTN